MTIANFQNHIFKEQNAACRQTPCETYILINTSESILSAYLS